VAVKPLQQSAKTGHQKAIGSKRTSRIVAYQK
jgi:hypothetical protein